MEFAIMGDSSPSLATDGVARTIIYQIVWTLLKQVRVPKNGKRPKMWIRTAKLKIAN
jgi:hypothetical protein